MFHVPPDSAAEIGSLLTVPPPTAVQSVALVRLHGVELTGRSETRADRQRCPTCRPTPATAWEQFIGPGVGTHRGASPWRSCSSPQ